MLLTANPTPPREQPKTEMVYTDEHTAQKVHGLLESQGYVCSLIAGDVRNGELVFVFDVERN